MSKFNGVRAIAAPVTNLHGARAYSLDAKTELATIVATSFVSDQFYRSADDTVARVRELLPLVGVEFAAKAAIYARTQFGMRSISHVVAGELAEHAKGHAKIRSLFDKVVQRPDDMTEIAAYHRKIYGGTRLPNAMAKGFKSAFNRFNDHQLAKYKMDSKDFSLVDLVNIVKPKPTERNAEALRLLVKDKLAQTGTWEDKISAAGSDLVLKAQAWKELIDTGSIGYLALIRNLRNIASAVDSDTLTKALALVTDPERIKKANIFPFQLYTAYTQLTDNKVRKAVSAALDICCSNCPDLANTLVAIDVSHSMDRSATGGTATCTEIADLFGSVLANRSAADLMIFTEDAQYIKYDPNGSIISTMEFINSHKTPAYTIFSSVFERANKKYDRIIFISDGQCNVGTVQESINRYKRAYDADPFIYSVDLLGYGTTQFKGKYYTVTGLTDKVFDLISRAETDPRVLVHDIESVEL